MAALAVGGAFLSASLQVLFDKLSSPTLREFGSLLGIECQLHKLHRTLLKILSVVSDAEMMQINDQSLKIWLKELKDAAYDAEDILEEFEAEVLRQQVKTRNQVSDFLSSLSPNQVLFHRDISKKINTIWERLDDVAKDRDDFMVGQYSDRKKTNRDTNKRVTSSLVDEASVFGRERDKEKMVKFLISDDRNQPITTNISLLVIAGMGGVGKTTLAQLAYNDERIDSYFQIKIWIHVSEDFDRIRITREIMEAVTKGQCYGYTNWNLVQDRLKEEVRGKRLLLILDDVWNDDFSEWEQQLLPMMPCKRGSKIVMTTRNQKMANIMDSATLYNVECVTDQDCWYIFKRHAFNNAISGRHPKLGAIVKLLVDKVKGLPLAAKALARLLCSRFHEESWRALLDSEIWELPQDGHDIISSLKLSYQKLPTHLKQCFGYCALFPKGHELVKPKLIQLWMAQGYIQPQGRRDMEDVGSECFEDLFDGSFFQQYEESYFVHDIMHGLAKLVSLDECFTLRSGELHKISENARHFLVHSDDMNEEELKRLQKFKRLRTLIFLHANKSAFELISEELFIKLKYLRVLDLNHSFIKQLPDSIGNLKLLRYLDLSNTGITELPNAIGNLHKLQTLKIEGCRLKELPKDITNLINIRHFEADPELVSTISGIGKLSSLRELLKFKVHDIDGHKITELKNMEELRQIHISELENVGSTEEARSAKLVHKKHIHSLTLEWSYNREINQMSRILEDDVLEGLQPHRNLRELNIWDNAGGKFPTWMNDEFLSNLERLRLRNCKSWEVLPCLGQFRFLKYLEISGMDGVKLVDQLFDGDDSITVSFPSLLELLFIDMPEWKEWCSPKDVQQFPHLKELLIVSCPRLQELPPLPSRLTRLWIKKVGLQSLPDLESLMFLSSLEVSECPNLLSLQQGPSNQHPSTLESLVISDCAELVHIMDCGFSSLSSLKSLTVQNCPKLTALLKYDLPSSLAHLYVTGCPDITIRCLHNLTSLYSLSISECPNLSSFPEEAMCNMKALEELTISGCQEPILLQYHALPSLKRLTIENCPMLQSPTLCSSSSSLEYLEINNVSSIAGLLRNLSSLLTLRIESCPQLVSFAEEEEELQKLTSLQSMHIHHCVNLEVLPSTLHKLSSLERLYIQDCPGIQSLPDSGLPNSLAVLDIRECPILQRQCQQMEVLTGQRLLTFQH